MTVIKFERPKKQSNTNRVMEDILELFTILALQGNNCVAFRLNTTGTPRVKTSQSGEKQVILTKSRKKGVADIFAQYHGIPIWIEVKRPKEKLSMDQYKFCCEMMTAGSVYLAVTEVAEVDDWIKSIPFHPDFADDWGQMIYDLNETTREKLSLKATPP